MLEILMLFVLTFAIVIGCLALAAWVVERVFDEMD